MNPSRLFHYTNDDGYKAISSQPDWVFKVEQPPGEHPVGAYFTSLGPERTDLARRLRIPNSKLRFVFCFTAADDLRKLRGLHGIARAGGGEATMIGGADIVIDTTLKETALDVAARCVRRAWPAAIFEDAETGERSPTYANVSFGRTKELFVYRDADSAKAWEEHGAIPAVANTMIHLLIGAADLTVVVDNPKSGEMRQIVASIRDRLDMDIFRMVAHNVGKAA